MKKAGLLARLEQVAISSELKEIEDGTMLTVLDLLLDYIGDADIRAAADKVVM